MKGLHKVILMLLLLILTFLHMPSFPEASANTADDFRIDYGLPDDVPREPMPENFTTQDFLNTTNPYADSNDIQGWMSEVDDVEGNHPLYVLIFGDEEEREIERLTIFEDPVNWECYARYQIERGDEALIANFGIDIRILDFLEWDSNDQCEAMLGPSGLFNELQIETRQYLRQWYTGDYWSNYVDAIIGITAQATPDDSHPIAGLASWGSALDEGRIFVLLKWQCYWMDDNLVQHEVSHLYYADDHPEEESTPCCVMAYHWHHNWWYLWEDGFWSLGGQSIRCAFTNYSWCASCNQTIQLNSGMYPLVVQTLDIASSSGGTTVPGPEHHTYRYGLSVNVTATPSYGFYFLYWILDNNRYYQSQITVTMNANHNLTAHFATPAMKTKTDGNFYIPNIASTQLKIEMLFNNSNIIGDQTGGTSPYTMIPVPQYPDGHVNAKDATLISSCFGKNESEPGWNYMADVKADKIINSKDAILVGANFGKNGSYIIINDYSEILIVFNTGQEIQPDSNGYVPIPQGATSFTVKRNNTPIGAMIIYI